MKDHFLRNKGPYGVLFTGLYTWAAINNCKAVFDILIDPVWCGYITKALGYIGPFLIGAGVLPSDFREKVVQGKIDAIALKKEDN